MGRRKEAVKPTPENEAKAQEFMNWYAGNIRQVRQYIPGCEYSEDIASDALIRGYNAIARGGTVVNDYLRYFLKTYRSTFLDSRKASDVLRADEMEIAGATVVETDTAGYEEAVESLRNEISGYVRSMHDGAASMVFEIYTELYPNASYPFLSRMLGIPRSRVKMWVGGVKKDIVEHFGSYNYNSLLA